LRIGMAIVFSIMFIAVSNDLMPYFNLILG
jgi:hypothetical protein